MAMVTVLIRKLQINKINIASTYRIICSVECGTLIMLLRIEYRLPDLGSFHI